MERQLPSLVRDTIDRYQMLCAGDTVIAGVSGGADSTALLRLLILLSEQMDLRVVCVHVEHGIRGASALQDAAWVEELCGRLGVPCRVVHVDAHEYAKEHGLSEEEAGRILRYEAFRQAAGEIERTTYHYNTQDGDHADKRNGHLSAAQDGAPAGHIRIAVAHTADDNAETMLFDLARGTGLDGLAGIPPVRGRIIRPLIDVTRAQIEAWLESIGQDWRTDETNLANGYARNRIRHEAIPALTGVNAGAVAHMRGTAQLVRDTAAWLDGVVQMLLGQMETEGSALEESLIADEEPISVLSRRAAGIPEVLRAELLHAWLAQAAGVQRDLTDRHVRLLEDLLEGTAGRRIDLPYGLVAVSGYQTIQLYHRERLYRGRGDATAADSPAAADSFSDTEPCIHHIEENGTEDPGSDSDTEGRRTADRREKPPVVIPYNMKPQDEGIVGWGGQRFRWRILAADGSAAYSRKIYTKTLDYDKITQDVTLRGRRMGDYISLESGARQSLKRYLINAKVPQGQRDRIPLVCMGSEVLWIVGYRISASVKVDETTSHILEIRRLDGEDE